VVVYGVMQEGIPAARRLACLLLVVVIADGAGQLAMPATVGDACELLEVDVHQIPGCVVLVATRR
jgi:hypothetical protein